MTGKAWRKAGPLTEAQILAWADAHRRRTGRWPTAASGPVRAAAGKTWAAINVDLIEGYRGLPGGDSLSRLLDRRRRASGPASSFGVAATPYDAASRRGEDGAWLHGPRTSSGETGRGPPRAWPGSGVRTRTRDDEGRRR